MKIFKSCMKSFAKEFKWKNFGFEYNQLEHFYRSKWQSNECSILYLIYRWICSLFFIGLFTSCLVLQFSDGKIFIFLTNWGIILCLFTQLTAALLVTCWHFDLGEIRATIYDHDAKAITGVANSMRTPTIVKIYWLLHGVALLLALVITTVYWIFLHGKMNKPVRFPTISFATHCLNSVFMLTDFLVIGFPMRLLHTVYAMLLPIFYCLFTVLYYFCGGEDEYGNRYVYPILDWKSPSKGIITFAGVFSLYVVYCLILFLLDKLKNVIYCASRVVWKPHAVALY
ncbi:protein rolling stone [Teleopsis dalmanni]|uniref:protein rolling stone n=1 Tax=Teleopsis dalmanni TaxID=139649 RepID=UPI0018CDE18E|nr:protein rolling stone [Teleopsis dalmanni]